MIIARFKGGIGNQFFLYHFAQQLSINLKQRNIFIAMDYENKLYRKYNIKFRINEFYNIKTINSKLIYYLFIIYRRSRDNNFESKTNYKKQFLKLLSIFLNTKLIVKLLPIVYIDESNMAKLKIENKIILLDGYWIGRNFFQPKIIPIPFSRDINLSEDNKTYLKMILNSESVSIHIRGNQYLTSYKDEYAPIRIVYYLEAIKYIKKELRDFKLFIFTDDIKYAKFIAKHFDNYIFVDTDGPDFQHFYLMSSCKHNIIINSTFSYWAAVINKNKNKVVIAPKKWSGEKVVNNNYDQLPFPNWVLINN